MSSFPTVTKYFVAFNRYEMKVPFAVFEPDSDENEDEYKKIHEEYKNLVSLLVCLGKSKKKNIRNSSFQG